MKKWVLDSCMNTIKKHKEYDEIKLAAIRYGLEGLYLTITKIIVIAIICYMLNLFKEFAIFIFIYSIIRMPSFGLHATKSWICLLSSTIIFTGVPYLCNIIELNDLTIVLVGILLLFLFYKNAPADTEKRPIINPKRRSTYKTVSVIICLIFIILAIIITNTFLSNCLILALVTQSFMISPAVYKIFNLKYDNYKNYLPKAI